MTVTNYQRIEHGRQNVTVETMVRIANALGVRTADLFAPLSGFEAAPSRQTEKGSTLEPALEPPSWPRQKARAAEQ